MTTWRVFYSWQSDLPNSTNRAFIQNALEAAAKNIARDESVEIEPVIDRDTLGVAGAPNIAETIFRKISESQVFVCDVSLIHPPDSDRQTPNPNVLIELGYAVAKLGQERIVMVLNTAFGGPEKLPFDLKMKRDPAGGEMMANGTRPGPYEILAPLVVGGMGKVYRSVTQAWIDQLRRSTNFGKTTP